MKVGGNRGLDRESKITETNRGGQRDKKNSSMRKHGGGDKKSEQRTQRERHIKVGKGNTMIRVNRGMSKHIKWR